MDVTFFLTAFCNAQCEHCAVDAGPSKSRLVAVDRICAAMTEAERLCAVGERLIFNLTGGEPLLDVDSLTRILRHGATLGATMTCVTNAYWASSRHKALDTVRLLRDAGLNAIAVSTSVFHQRWVSMHRVREALTAAQSLGLQTELKISYTDSDARNGQVQSWISQAGPAADVVSAGPVVPYVREGARFPDETFATESSLPGGRCPASAVTVREDGSVFNCCAPGAFRPLLNLGTIPADSFETVHDRFCFEPVLQVLRERGPAHIARYAIERGEAKRLRARYAGVCDLCAHIANDPVLEDCARRAAREYRHAWAHEVMNRIAAGPDG